MSRVYNFSAGPAMLPEEVLKQCADEMMDYKGSGQSVMEMSHRSKVYDEIIKTAEADFRELVGIPDNYKVLFLQGGASTQFAAIPLNFMNGTGKADYVITGQWAKKAFEEAARRISGPCGRRRKKLCHRRPGADALRPARPEGRDRRRGEEGRRTAGPGSRGRRCGA